MTTMTEPRTWTLLVPAPCRHISVNATTGHWRNTSEPRKQWRNQVFQFVQRSRLPKGLDRVRVDVLLHFPDRRSRDAGNYTDTAKPAVDALGPPFLRMPTAKNPSGASAPGWALIPDDTPDHLDGPHVDVGPLWREVLAATNRPLAALLASPFGGITLTITDLSEGVPA